MNRCGRCGRELSGPFGCALCDQKARRDQERDEESQRRDRYEREKEAQRNRDHANNLQKESDRAQRERDREREREARARAKEADQKEEERIQALEALEEKKFRREEQLQNKAQKDKEQFEIQKRLQDVALLTVNDQVRANQSLRILLNSNLFKEHANFVQNELAENPALLGLVSQILNENALEEAKRIMKEVTKENLLPKLLGLQDGDKERVVSAILNNKMPEQHLGMNLSETLLQRVEELTRQSNKYKNLFKEIYSSVNLNFKEISFSDAERSEIKQSAEKAFKYYHICLKHWEFLLNQGKILFPTKVQQILSSLDQDLEKKQLEVATISSPIVLAKMLKQDAFKKEYNAHIELQKKEGWDSYLYSFIYSFIFFSIFTSYFEIEISSTVGVFIFLGIGVLFVACKQSAKNIQKEKSRGIMAGLVRSIDEDVELISAASVGLENTIDSIRANLATVKTKIIEFYQQEKIDLGEDIQKAFLVGSMKLEQFSRSLLTSTCDLAKLVACQKAFNYEFLGTSMPVPVGKLYYPFSIKQDEAKKLGDFLSSSKYFVSPDQVCQIDRVCHYYSFRFFSPFSEAVQQNKNFDIIFGELADSLSTNVFNGSPLIIYWCDLVANKSRRFDNIKIPKDISIKDKGFGENSNKLNALFLLAVPKYELAWKLLESMIAVASVDGKIGASELETLISFSCQLKESFFQNLDIRSIFESLIREIEPMNTSSKLHLLGMNGVYFSKAMQPKIKGSFLADFKTMINADGKVTSNESKCFEILEKTMTASLTVGDNKCFPVKAPTLVGF